MALSDLRSAFSNSTSTSRECEAATLVVGKSHPAVTKLFPKNSISLNEIFDHLLLALVHPAAERNDKK